MSSDVSTGTSRAGAVGGGIAAAVHPVLEEALAAVGCKVWHWAGAVDVPASPGLGDLFGPPGQIEGVRAVSSGPWGAELQVALVGGGIRWLECRRAVTRDGRGTVTGTTGVVLDITDRKHQQEAARHEVAARQAALEERDELVRLVQRTVLPPQLPQIDGVDLAARYLPMGAGIGGDFYDVFPVGTGTWGIMLGDVCGKGAAAASTTALTRYTLRAAALAGRGPAPALELLNQALLTVERDAERRICTAIFAELYASRPALCLRAAVAGHPPILVLREDGALEAHGPTGPLLGVLEPVVMEERLIDLRPGDACVLYTDGATDVRHGRETFGDARLAEVVSSCRSMSAEAIASQVEGAVVGFQRGDLRDDFALVVLAIPPQVA
jgi:phosphoserine phosphatase RsbU/P